MTAIFRVFVALSMIVLVVGHGHIKDPPSRNAAWKYNGRKTPVQHTPNELNCGGFSRQWKTNKGKCGACGDPYDETSPQYVDPGKYATKSIIARTYREGQDIEVKIVITSNHQGFFTFRVGDIGTPPITQEKLKYVLKQPNGETTWKINTNGNDEYKITLRLPEGLTCDHCVMQWWWKVANSWGCDKSGCGMGKGEQETFVNCADIRITKSDGSVPPPPPTRPPPPTQQPPKPTTEKPTEPPPTNAPNPGGCKAVGAWQGNANMDNWCVQNCAAGNCPDSMCKCP